MNNNDNEFNAINGNNLASVYELISTYGMEAMPQAMEILFNEAMLIERTQHLGVGHYERSNNRLDYANGYMSGFTTLFPTFKNHTPKHIRLSDKQIRLQIIPIL